MSEVLEFNVAVNLADAVPVDVTMQDPPAGPFEVEFLDVRQVTKEGEGGGKTTIRANVAICEEGPAKGLATLLVIGTDWSKPFNKNHLFNCLLGLHTKDGKHANPEALKKLPGVTPALFKNMRGYIFVKTPPEGEIDDSGRPARANKNFITKEQYEAQKRAIALGATPGAGAAKSAAPASNGTPKAAPSAPVPSAPIPAPTGAADLNDLFKQ